MFSERTINELMLALGQVGVIALAGAVGALLFRRDFKWRWFVAGLAIYLLYDALLTRGLFMLPRFPEGANWNWMGKVLAVGGMLAIAALPAFGFTRSGITLKQKPGVWLPLLVTAALAGYFLYLSLPGDGKPDDLETIAFQWTMPGLDEEIFYRGVFLLAMNEAFRPRLNVLGAPISYGGLLTSLMFGLAHAMDYDASGYSFDAMIFLQTGAPSLILLWLRERTGSILLPILAHNIANGVSTLI